MPTWWELSLMETLATGFFGVALFVIGLAALVNV